MQGISNCHPMMLVFISSIIFYNLAYTAQAWIGNLKTCVMQANICNAHTNVIYKFMSLLPPTCVLQILIDPLPFTYLTIFGFSPPFTYLWELLLLLCHQ
jgi:hypothetical protein